MDKSIIEEMMNGDPNTRLDDRLFYQFTTGLEEEIDKSGWLSLNRIADYIGKGRPAMRTYLRRHGGMTYGLAMEIWGAVLIISTGYNSEQPILNKHQLRFVRQLGNKYGIANVDRLCVSEGVAPRGRFERVYDDFWFKEYRRCSDAKTYTPKEIIDRCAAYTFNREEWVEFRKKVCGKLKPPRVHGRGGKAKLFKMVREMGRDWVAQIINVPLATLLSRHYRYYIYTVEDFMKVKKVYEDPTVQDRIRKEIPKEYVDRDMINNELLPFIEQRLKFGSKEKKAVNAIRLARLSGLSYNQLRSKIYMGTKMTVEEYDTLMSNARMLYKEAIECGGRE